jgi:hypothetical protein
MRLRLVNRYTVQALGFLGGTLDSAVGYLADPVDRILVLRLLATPSVDFPMTPSGWSVHLVESMAFHAGSVLPLTRRVNPVNGRPPSIAWRDIWRRRRSPGADNRVIVEAGAAAFWHPGGG